MIVPTPTGKITQPGHYQIPLGEYLGQPCDALCMGSSDAQVLAHRSPAKLIATWNEERTAARKPDFGSAVHALILEPQRAESVIEIVKAKDYKTDAAKAMRDRATAAGRIPLLTADYERAQRAAETALKDPEVRALLREGTAEESWYAKDARTGIYRRARPDFYNSDGVIIDVKVVGTFEDKFIRSRIYEGGWFQQAPWHAHVIESVQGRPASDYRWLCIEEDEPHEIAIIQPTEAALIHGATLNAAAFDLFTRCALTGIWPRERRVHRQEGLPDWAYYQLEADAVRKEDEAARGMEAARYGRETNTNPFG